MKITILNRTSANKYIPKGSPAIWISATDPDKEPMNPRSEYLASLHLYFHDVMNDDARKIGLKPITYDQARDIVKFLLRYENEAREIVLNCEAGMSRSAGIAAAICQMYELPDDICYNGGRFPNRLVKSKILEVYNESIERTINSGPS